MAKQTKTEAKTEETEVAGKTCYLVDISGTFSDRRTQNAENYRMLAAIIETEGMGTYFIKANGPAKTMDANAEKFENFVKSLVIK